ncbi:hypothetical protein C0Q70_14766 [Pomacea canaliculata]|uniref:Uncharacterized protein n=1 Tax=Pomacea canaliculata TaxID=400727 RepID=A0A2T7NSZ9_POMCA|nr:hypothetical protein C0Q70_14766 [Pomacea canaliculata]
MTAPQSLSRHRVLNYRPYAEDGQRVLDHYITGCWICHYLHVCGLSITGISLYYLLKDTMADLRQLSIEHEQGQVKVNTR